PPAAAAGGTSAGPRPGARPKPTVPRCPRRARTTPAANQAGAPGWGPPPPTRGEGAPAPRAPRGAIPASPRAAARGGRARSRPPLVGALAGVRAGAAGDVPLLLLVGVVRLVLLPLRLRQEFVLQLLLAVGLAQHVVALRLHLRCELQQDGDGGQEDRGGLPGPAGPDEPADGLGAVQGRGGTGRVHAHAQPWHVDALGDHAHGDHPLVCRVRELADAARRRGIVGQDQHGGPARDLRQQGRVLARPLLVGRDDEPTGVGDATVADLTEPR